MRGVVYLNGRFVKAVDAKISVFDRGLLFGDGLFETLRAYRGVPFALDEHVERMTASARALGIELPTVDWQKVLGSLIGRNRLRQVDARVRITVTRGSAEPALLPPPGIVPAILSFCQPVETEMAAMQQRGIAAAILPFGERGILAGHKALNYLPAVLGRRWAQRHGAVEGIYTIDGRVTEGTTSTLFAWCGGRLVTPPLHGILPGVTRSVILRIAGQNKTPIEEREIRVSELIEADEVFLTGSVSEVLPVIAIDGTPIGSGRPGRRTRGIQSRYRRYVQRCIQASSN